MYGYIKWNKYHFQDYSYKQLMLLFLKLIRENNHNQEQVPPMVKDHVKNDMFFFVSLD